MKLQELLYDFLNQNKKWVGTRFLLTLLNFPLEAIVISKLTGKIFTELATINKKNYSNIKNVALYIVFIYAFLEISMSINDFYETKFWPRLDTHLRQYMYDKVMEKSEINYDSAKIGEITTRLLKVPWLIETYFEKTLTFVVPFVITLLVIIIYIFYNNKILGIFISVFCIIYYFMFYLLSRSGSKLRYKREKWENIVHENISDKIANSINIYTNGQIDNERNDLLNQQTKFGNMEKRYYIQRSKIKFYIGLLNIIFFAILIYLIIKFGIEGKISKEQMITLMTISLFLIKYIRMMSRRVVEVSMLQGSFNEMNNYLNTLNNMTAPNGHKTNFLKDAKIDIKNLNFRYNNKLENVLDNINVTFEPKQDYIILGHSGSGKTTLVKLILGFYEHNEGTLKIDGIDMNQINRRYLRQHISYINQSTTLFDRTLIENIAYGTGKSNEYIKKKVKGMKVMQVFRELENGLNTPVGKNGDRLSGGQRQILLMLRNYFRPAKVLILDEPTSAIDSYYKKYVIELINELKKSRTIIIITHDYSIVNNFTHKIKMENGKIISK